ncbi:MAG: type II toxin-antitoxin system HicB family antitoxin [Bacteroidetes bacterium]|nr:type II toxin-antitoxin system HicB family antitoxin [Bacteroidota bacterium]
MKIDGVIIKDATTGKFFGFVRQFPGVCAQANTVNEVSEKINAYFQIFVNKLKNEEISMDENQVTSM